MPEIWCRLSPQERSARWLIELIEQEYLEPVADFDYQGRRVPASRLGYRITTRFLHAFLGKIFDDPVNVFDEAMLRPETQDIAAFVAGVEHIAAMHTLIAKGHIEDGSVHNACPPLKALLYIMAEGSTRAGPWPMPASAPSSRANICWPATGIASASTSSNSAPSRLPAARWTR